MSIVSAQQSEVVANSSSTHPILVLKETQANDFARLWFQTTGSDKWALNAKPTPGQFDSDNTLESPIVFAFNGAQKLGLSQDGKLRINKSYVLPNADGNAGQVLSTNGFGVVDWITSSGGDSNQINDTDGNSFIKVEDANKIVADLDGENIMEILINNNGYARFNFKTKDQCLFVGSEAGLINNGFGNTGVGSGALFQNSSGQNNTALGRLTLALTSEGENNTGIGENALGFNTSGNTNTACGAKSLNQLKTGNGNVAIGYNAGFSTLGSNNVFIGVEAGYNETGSNKLYIDNSNTSTPLIFGNFLTNELVINGSLETTGNIIPEAHKSDDLGQDGLAWDDVYADDLVNQGIAAFDDRIVVEELVQHSPRAKKKGSFDYKTDKGLIELDPASLPAVLTQGNGILIDEMASYNYKANYEQQLIITQLLKTVEALSKRIEDLENK